MNFFPLLLAWRTITTKQAAPTVLMLGICSASIIIATCALSLIVAIMNGFELETHKKLQGIHDDITIRAYNQELDVPRITTAIKKEVGDEIISITARATQHGLLVNDDNETHVVLVTGIDLNQIMLEKFRSMLQVDGQALENLQQKGTFLISEMVNETFGLHTGSEILIAFPDEVSAGNKMYFQKKQGTIAGTFKSGIEDIDMGVIFCSLPTFTSLLHNEINQIGLTLRPGVNAQSVAHQLQLRFGPQLDILTWQDMYPALIDALKLEKYAMFFILALVVLVASMSILALLFMLINQKRVEIAVMRSHGITRHTIRQAYLLLGCSLSVVSALAGIILSALFAWALEHYQLIKLPDVYLVTHVPAHMTSGIIIAVLLLTFLLSLGACLIATTRIAQLQVADVLRFES